MLSRIKSLCQAHSLTIAELERQTGIARGTIGKWDVSSPSVDKVKLVADHFHVSVDHLLGATPAPSSELSKRSHRDINQAVENMRLELSQSEGLLFDGQPASAEAIESLLIALEMGMEIAKKRNKEKYTPKKYKK